MTPTDTKQLNDPDIHKGAVEGDRPSDEQNVRNKGTGIDKNGIPNDPVSTAQDANGANADGTQG